MSLLLLNLMLQEIELVLFNSTRQVNCLYEPSFGDIQTVKVYICTRDVGHCSSHQNLATITIEPKVLYPDRSTQPQIFIRATHWNVRTTKMGGKAARIALWNHLQTRTGEFSGWFKQDKKKLPESTWVNLPNSQISLWDQDNLIKVNKKIIKPHL
jgi:hypothetical protein